MIRRTAAGKLIRKPSNGKLKRCTGPGTCPPWKIGDDWRSDVFFSFVVSQTPPDCFQADLCGSATWQYTSPQLPAQSTSHMLSRIQNTPNQAAWRLQVPSSHPCVPVDSELRFTILLTNPALGIGTVTMLVSGYVAGGAFFRPISMSQSFTNVAICGQNAYSNSFNSFFACGGSYGIFATGTTLP